MSCEWILPVVCRPVLSNPCALYILMYNPRPLDHRHGITLNTTPSNTTTNRKYYITAPFNFCV